MMHFEEWVRATWLVLENRDPVDADRDYTQAEIRTVLDAAMQALVDELVRGGHLSMTDFGQLAVKERPLRRVADNIRGGTHYVEARRTVVFRPSRVLQHLLNSH
jgi:nucleoid DNA-binding protein